MFKWRRILVNGWISWPSRRSLCKSCFNPLHWWFYWYWQMLLEGLCQGDCVMQRKSSCRQGIDRNAGAEPWRPVHSQDEEERIHNCIGQRFLPWLLYVQWGFLLSKCHINQRRSIWITRFRKPSSLLTVYWKTSRRRQEQMSVISAWCCTPWLVSGNRTIQFVRGLDSADCLQLSFSTAPCSQLCRWYQLGVFVRLLTPLCFVLSWPLALFPLVFLPPPFHACSVRICRSYGSKASRSSGSLSQ